jgi:AcrR family transcriptional regulator
VFRESERDLPKTLNPDEIAAFRDRLCEVAERLFAEKGPAAVTVRELAAELGVSPMTPYRYFTDKDAMLAAVRARAFDRFAAAMEAAIGAGRGQDDEPANPYVDFALGHPAAYRMMFDVTQPTFEQYPDLLRAMQRARATMSVGVRQAAANGAAIKDIELVSHMIWATMHGPIMLELAGLLEDGMTARRLINAAIPALGRGLRSGEP